MAAADGAPESDTRTALPDGPLEPLTFSLCKAPRPALRTLVVQAGDCSEGSATVPAEAPHELTGGVITDRARATKLSGDALGALLGSSAMLTSLGIHLKEALMFNDSANAAIFLMVTRTLKFRDLLLSKLKQTLMLSTRHKRRD